MYTIHQHHQQIAFRAAVLEQENAILRTQLGALRDEVGTLRQVICVQSTVSPPSLRSATTTTLATSSAASITE